MADYYDILRKAVGGLERAENEPDWKGIDDLGGAAEVIAVRVRHNQRGQPANSERSQLRRHMRLRRALVDEHRTRLGLEEDSVALSDVEHDEAEARGRRRRVLLA